MNTNVVHQLFAGNFSAPQCNDDRSARFARCDETYPQKIQLVNGKSNILKAKSTQLWLLWEAFSLKVRANRISVIAEYLYMIVISKVKASTGYQSKQFSDDSSRTLITTWIILRQNKNNNDVAKFPLPRFFALPFTSLLFFRCLEHDVWHQLLWRWVIKCK